MRVSRVRGVSDSARCTDGGDGVANDDGNDEAVNAKHARHDDRDDVLHHNLWDRRRGAYYTGRIEKRCRKLSRREQWLRMGECCSM